MRTIPSLLAAVSMATAAIGVTAPSNATDWPQVRGPARNGIAAESGLLSSWREGQPAVVWRRPIGAGFSSVTAAGGALYTMAAEGADEVLLRLDPVSGETRWRRPVGKTFESQFGDGPRSTPAVDGDTVYAISADAQLVALATADGTVRWHHDLPATFGDTVPRFGYSPSPLLDGDLLLLEVGGGEGKPAVVAFDKRSGETRWAALDGPAGFSSPVAATIGGVRQYVFSRRVGPEVVAVSSAGDVLWRHPGARAAIPMPIFVPPDRIFVSSSDDDYGGVMLRVVPGAEGGAASVEELWSNRLMRNHFNSSVVIGGQLYGFDNATFKCLDLATGERRWAHRGFGKGSLASDGARLFVLGDDGTLALVEASPEGYHERGRTQAMTGKAWTAPTLANGRLYLRDHDEIVSLDVRGDTAGAAPAASGAVP